MEDAAPMGWKEEDYQDYAIPPDNRRGFISKVLGIITIQMFITVAITTGIVSWSGSDEFFKENWWIMFPFFAMMIIPEIMLLCCMNTVARRVPLNYILLLIFTLGLTGLVAMICSFYEPLSVLIVAFLTCGVTCILTAYAIFTDRDLTKSLWIVCAFSCAMSCVGLGLMFVSVPRGVAILISCVWIIIYSWFLMIDVQRLVGGDKKYKFSEEDYIVAALQIYLDIIMLFLELLSILGKGK